MEMRNLIPLLGLGAIAALALGKKTTVVSEEEAETGGGEVVTPTSMTFTGFANIRSLADPNVQYTISKIDKVEIYAVKAGKKKLIKRIYNYKTGTTIKIGNYDDYKSYTTALVVGYIKGLKSESTVPMRRSITSTIVFDPTPNIVKVGFECPGGECIVKRSKYKELCFTPYIVIKIGNQTYKVITKKDITFAGYNLGTVELSKLILTANVLEDCRKGTCINYLRYQLGTLDRKSKVCGHMSTTAYPDLNKQYQFHMNLYPNELFGWSCYADLDGSLVGSYILRTGKYTTPLCGVRIRFNTRNYWMEVSRV